MIDFNEVEKYRENNRIEAKKALGGLPESLWETYSAFANTMGGVILLGVEEHSDHSLHTVNLPEPDALIHKFWSIVNDPMRVSINILTDSLVSKHVVDGKNIVSIEVPRAQRTDRPVYIDNNPRHGTYRRSGEGDYRCSEEEVESMRRDAELKTQDMRVITELDTSALDTVVLDRYRSRALRHNPGYAGLGTEEFLIKTGAAVRGGDGVLHPTGAGLLMFGYEREIIRVYPQYMAEYIGEAENGEPLRICGGNIYEFFFSVYPELIRGIELDDPEERGAVCGAVREALANALINADYLGRGGISVKKNADEIVIENPGSFRVDAETAASGGVSDPRNAALIKLFGYIEVCGGAGRGIPSIYMTWKNQGWEIPEITELFDPERISVKLRLRKGKRRLRAPLAIRTLEREKIIIEFLTRNPSASLMEISEVIGTPRKQTREILNGLIDKGIISSSGSGRCALYMLSR